MRRNRNCDETYRNLCFTIFNRHDSTAIGVVSFSCHYDLLPDTKAAFPAQKPNKKGLSH